MGCLYAQLFYCGQWPYIRHCYDALFPIRIDAQFVISAENGIKQQHLFSFWILLMQFYNGNLTLVNGSLPA